MRVVLIRISAQRQAILTILVKIGREYWALYVNIYMHVWDWVGGSPVSQAAILCVDMIVKSVRRQDPQPTV
jgi:hypothetical protein